MANTQDLNFLAAFTLGTLALLAMAVAIISFVLYYQRRVIAHQLELKRKDEEMLRAVILSQEEEQRRIAKDLHDDMGATFSAIRLKIIEIEAKTKGNDLAAININESKEMINDAVAQIRNISHRLFPPEFEMQGLKKTLENVCPKISSAELQIQLLCPKNYTCISNEKELAVYRVVMELLNNIIKHSGANTATVTLTQSLDNSLEITVSDNGCGFDVSKLNEMEGLGLKSIESRISAIKANINFQSSSAGTVVKINVSGN